MARCILAPVLMNKAHILTNGQVFPASRNSTTKKTMECTYKFSHSKKIWCMTRSASNPMDKGACNSVYYQYYGKNSNMASSVTMVTSSYRITRMYRMNHHFILLCDESEASFEGKATEP